MNVGDILQIKPTLDVAAGFTKPEALPCKVVYIHPLKRFFVVEFKSARGQTWREAVYFPVEPSGDFYRHEARFNNRRTHPK